MKKKLKERDKSVNECVLYFRVNELEIGVNDTIFSGKKQQKVYKRLQLNSISNVSNK